MVLCLGSWVKLGSGPGLIVAPYAGVFAALKTIGASIPIETQPGSGPGSGPIQTSMSVVKGK